MASVESKVNDAISQVFSQAQGSAVDPDAGMRVIASLSQLGTELRIWVDKANALGHHASTISLVKRMVDYGFKAPIRLFLEDPADAAKLEILLPGYVVPAQGPPPATLQYRGVQLNFVYGPKPPPDDVAPLLLSGGSDMPPKSAAPRRLQAANCHFYLQLQPWNWKELDFLAYGSTIDLIGKQPSLGAPNFSRRPYTQPAAVRDGPTWALYGQNPRFKLRVAMAYALADDLVSQARYYLPIYGLDAGAKWSALITLILGSLRAQDLMPGRHIPPKPIVLLMFNNYGDQGISWWPKLARWLDGTSTDDDYSAAFRNYVTQNNIAKRVALNWDDPTNPNPNPTRLHDQLEYTVGNRVLVVAMDGTPQEIFNYFYAQATLPFVFEGQGTASYALGLGKPYLSLKAWNYPSLDFSEDIPPASAVARAAAAWLTKADDVYEEQPDWQRWPSTGFAAALCDLVDDPASQAYFHDLGATYGAGVNDRLRMALRYLTSVQGWPPP